MNKITHTLLVYWLSNKRYEAIEAKDNLNIKATEGLAREYQGKISAFEEILTLLENE